MAALQLPHHPPRHSRVTRRRQQGPVTSSAATHTTRTAVAAAAQPHTQRPRLVLLRHGDAEADSGGVPDHQRRLTPAGAAAVRSLARRLADECTSVTPVRLVLCSDTVRSRETWQQLVEERPETFSDNLPVRFLSSLYTVACLDGETAAHLTELLRSELASSDAGVGAGSSVLCIGHNRGWEEAAAWFAGVPIQLQAASAAVLEAADGHRDWATVLDATAEAAVTHQPQAGPLANTAWVVRAVVTGSVAS